MKWIFLILLLLPIASAQEFNVELLDMPKVPMSPECQEQYKELFEQDITQVLKDYCDSTNSSSFYLLGISILILLAQPLVTKKNEFIGGAVKLLGLGMIVLVMIMLYFKM